MKQVISISLSLLLLAGCRSTAEKDPVRYSEDPENGLRKEVKAGELLYTIQYKPVAYLLLQEHIDPADKQALEARKKELEGYAWFNISFRVGNTGESPLRYKAGSMEEYNQRLDYYLNRAASDMYLLYGKDTLYASSYWFENGQGLTPQETIIAGFRLPGSETAPKEDLHFSFYDQVFKNGILKTIITSEALSAIPVPDFNK